VPSDTREFSISTVAVTAFVEALVAFVIAAAGENGSHPSKAITPDARRRASVSPRVRADDDGSGQANAGKVA